MSKNSSIQTKKASKSKPSSKVASTKTITNADMDSNLNLPPDMPEDLK